MRDQRDTFSSVRGAILATAGVAVGLGNIWRFPYMMGLYGGAAFLVLYLAIVALFGIPALLAEWTVGRHTRQSPVTAYSAAGFPAGKWVGYALFLTVMMASSYYAVIVGWVLSSAVSFAVGDIMTGAELFPALQSDLSRQLIFTAVAITLSCLALNFSVRGGIERASRIALPMFFGLFAVLLIRVLTLDGAWAGVEFYLVPRLDQFQASTVFAATGQAFFSLGLGGTFMLIYGSYLPADVRLVPGAFVTALTDTGAAFLAGLIVVPAVIIFGAELTSGPPLMFEVLPQVFGSLPGADFFGAIFFLAVALVGLLSLIASLEVLVVGLNILFGWRRRSALWVVGVVELGLAVPSMIDLDFLAINDLIWGSTMQPLGATMAVLAVGWCLGRSRFLAQIGHDATPLYYWIKYVLPAGIVVTLVYGWLA